MALQDNQRVVLSNVRFSFVNLLSPKAPQSGGDPKYSATILLPKHDLAGKQRLDAAIEAAIQAGIPSKWGGVRPAQPNIPIHDRDGLRPGGEPFGPECKWHWVFTASANLNYPPQVVGSDLQPIMNAAEIYSGMYGNVSIRTFPYFAVGKKGVGLGLEAVQKTRDGEPLGASVPDAAELFAGVQQPPQVQQPVYQPAPQGQYAAPQTTPYTVAPQPGQANLYQTPVTQQPVVIDPVTGKPQTGGIMGL